MKKITIIILLAILFCPSILKSQQPTWIWYPGDYEIWLSNKMQNRRTERGAFYPPFWKVDNHYVLMNFYKDVELLQPEEIAIYTEGSYNVKVDSKMEPGTPKRLTIPAGKHRVSIKIFNQSNVPAVFIKGKTIVSDASWLVTFEDKEWIDETGKVSDQSGTKYITAGYWNFNDPLTSPSAFHLPVTKQSTVKKEKNGKGLLVDFGKETFGFIKLHGLRGKGNVSLYYGESKEEALATNTCETLDVLQIDQQRSKDSVLTDSKAFRYVNIQPGEGVQIDSASMLYEYLPLENRGAFRCSDEQINKIWDVAAYTLHLNTREFFIDGIKRDRWIWSGDAYQSYVMNYYLFFDAPSVTRTLFALRGKDPVTSHINTIMDYSFYWFIGIYDYYLYTGDKQFIRQCYPRMQSLMEYCLSRRNKNGLMEGLSGDWIFIDWADGLSKDGEISFEQLLFCRSLETMTLCAQLLNDAESANKYQRLSADLKSILFNVYWNKDKQALMHSRVNGTVTNNITRYANMFGIFFNYFNDEQKQGVKKNVLLNNSVPGITTPYMKFYELEAMCAMGEQEYVLKQLKDYWGGMLSLGATSFWEEYNPAKKGSEHYAMYGRPFGKSLCHAWGASPIYLLGKYYLGIHPVNPGYETWLAEPQLGGLQWMDGKVPTPHGDIHLYCSVKQIKITSAGGMGTVRFKSNITPVCKEGTIQATGNNVFELKIEKGKEYIVNYEAK
jgi:alpha-L-rhamnosidase